MSVCHHGYRYRCPECNPPKDPLVEIEEACELMLHGESNLHVRELAKMVRDLAGIVRTRGR